MEQERPSQPGSGGIPPVHPPSLHVFLPPVEPTEAGRFTRQVLERVRPALSEGVMEALGEISSRIRVEGVPTPCSQ